MTTNSLHLHPSVFPLSSIAGLLVALGISLAARLETGTPPGLPPRPFYPLLERPAPAFVIQDLAGTPVSFQPGNPEQIRLLFFTHTGCKACDASYPALQQASEQMKVLVVGFGDRQILTEKIEQHAIVATVGYDSVQVTRELYRVSGFPSALLIDEAGIVRQAAVGSRSLEVVLGMRKETAEVDEGCTDCGEKQQKN